MSMRMDKFTVKAQEALQAAQSLADQHGHQAIEPEHLLRALLEEREGVGGPGRRNAGPRRRARLEQREGVVGPVLGKLGARPDAILREVNATLEGAPKVRGASGQYLGERTRQALERAQAEAQRRRDEYAPPQ